MRDLLRKVRGADTLTVEPRRMLRTHPATPTGVLLQLQRAAGNRAVVQQIQRSGCPLFPRS